jgi:DNA polymerase III subunit gamma/tau
LAGQALYLKYRPHVFADMIGQAHITETLRNTLVQNRLRHAYLFSGPRGTGKTTTARLLAKAVNCTYADASLRPCDQCAACVAVNEGRFLDLIEIDAASNNGIEDVRELRDKIGFAPNEGRYKVYVIDEVHRFSASAFDALLKTLEEPPGHAVFILATTELDKVPATIKSRCLKFEFRRVSTQEVADRLQGIAELEGLQIERAALELVARQGTGSVRDSISLLDQIVVDPNQPITLELAQAVLGTANHRAVAQIVDAICDNAAGRGLELLNQAIDEGADPRQLGGQIIEHLRAVLLAQTGGAEIVEGSEDQRAVYTAQAGRIPRGALLKAIRLWNQALLDLRASWQPQLPLELALIESTRPTAEEVATVAVARPAPVKSKTSSKQPEPEAELDADDGDEIDEDEIIEDGEGKPITLTDIRNLWPSFLAQIRTRENFSPLANRLELMEAVALKGNLLSIAPKEENSSNPVLRSRLSDLDERAFRKVIWNHISANLNFKVVATARASSGGDQPNVSEHLQSLQNELGGKLRARSRQTKQS